ncbi:MAG TPA: WD40 repeat domain-containing protein [Polyangiaceae bacterium]|nr:WD40 repeat domain-containing protein [Polyangiaceae bacterium]
MSPLVPFDPTCGTQARFAADSKHLLLGVVVGLNGVTQDASCAVDLESGAVVARVALPLAVVGFQAGQFVGPTDTTSFAAFDALGQPMQTTSFAVDLQDGALFLSPTGDRVAYQSHAGIQLFDRATGAVVVDTPPTYGSEYPLFSGDGSFVLLADRVLQSADGKVVATLSPGVTRPLWLSAEGRLLALQTGDAAGEKHFMLLDVSTNKPVRAFGGSTHPVLSVSVSPDGKRFATTNGRALLVWNIPDDFAASSVAWVDQIDFEMYTQFSPDGSKLALSGDSRALFSADGLRLFSPPPPAAPSTCPWAHFAFSPDGRFLAGAGNDYFVDVFDTATHELVTRLPSSGCNSTAAFSADGSFLVTGALEVYYTSDWSPVSPDAVVQVLASQTDNDAMNRAIFAPDGRHAIVSSCRTNTSIPDMYSICTQRLVLAGGGAGAETLTLSAPHPEVSPDGRFVLAGGGLLRLSPPEGRALDANLTSAAFSPNGDIIAGSRDGSIVRYCRQP